MHVVVRSAAAAIVGEADTDAEGRASFNLPPGAYTVQLTTPAGHSVHSANPVAVTLTFAVSPVTFDVGIVPTRVAIDPVHPRLAVGADPVIVRARAYDVRGQEVSGFSSIRWDSGVGVAASGTTLNGSLVGTSATAPGAGKFVVFLEGEAYEFDATVTAAISGTVRGSAESEPQAGVSVELRQGEGSPIASTLTDGSGRYRIDGLPAGSYQVSVADDAGMSSPSSRDVTLGGNAVNQDFTLNAISFDGGPQRPNVMVCGYTSHPVTTFFPEGTSYTVLSGCMPDGNTQALFITRGGSGYTGAWLKAYVQAGGVVITEYNISHNVWNAVFDTNVGLGYDGYYGRFGSCTDVLPSVHQFNPGDPLWQTIPFQPMNIGQTGCGYSVSHFPGLVPLAGWSASAAALGYRNLGYGRVWAADFDWQDNENYPFKTYTEQVLGYAMTHRGGVLPEGPALMAAPVAANARISPSAVRTQEGLVDTRALPASAADGRGLPRQR